MPPTKKNNVNHKTKNTLELRVDDRHVLFGQFLDMRGHGQMLSDEVRGDGKLFAQDQHSDKNYVVRIFHIHLFC